LDDRFEGIRRIEPLLCVQVLFHTFDLGVEGFWDEEICAVPEVFNEALRVSVGPRILQQYLNVQSF
jgi:hypothetical protein